jgi:Protein of unknown function (DUF2778)
VRPVGRRTGLSSLPYSGSTGPGVRNAGGGAAQARARSRGRSAVLPTVLGGVAFLALGLATALTVSNVRTADRESDGQAQPSVSSVTEARRTSLSVAYAELSAALKNAAYERLATALNGHVTRLGASNGYNLLFDTRYLGASPGIFAKTVALDIEDEPPASPSTVSAIPEATEDPSPAAAKDRQAARAATSPTPPVQSLQAKSASVRGNAAPGSTPASAPAQTPGIFERFIVKPYRMALAYASTGDASVDEGPSVASGPGIPSGRFDRWTAVYDISAHTVYMPDGTRLEAHSGLGSRLDDPRHVDERMHGSTPPNVYELEPRESLFHGVRALRLKPVDNDKVFGRAGLLAHSYLLGSRGDSNGCVSFRNYNAFLEAYNSHKIKRLAVVAHLD